MPGTLYPNATARTLSDKLGERFSVLDTGAVGDGSTDNHNAFTKAIAAAVTSGGCNIYLPKGEYVINTPLLIGSGVSNITFVGDGESTVIKRGASLTSGKGLIDIAGATNIGFRSLAIEGNVTTPTGLQYGTFSDPMDPLLSDNSSVWIHGGSTGISFEDVTVSHTGGYAILIDARTGDIRDVRILDCTFENNRPHLFGTVGDLNYGSWTGGVHYQGDGTSYAVQDLLVRGCSFRRNTGNCLWGHAYGFGKLHSNIQRLNNYFADNGLDGIEMGAESGGVVAHNHFRRMGYICTDDTSPSVPKYLTLKYAVAIDSTGLVRGVNVVGNTIISPNGGAMDLDGYGQGVVSGNVVIVPSSGEPEYTEDSIATSGPGGTGNNWVYGVQPGNTNNIAIPGTEITITGNTFVNCGGGSIRAFAVRNCYITGNNISAPAVSNYPPIALGNTGTGSYQRATGNVVTDNKIDYNPTTAAPAIFEDATYGAFSGSDKNWVGGNKLSGNCYEFQKDNTTASTTAVVMSASANSLTQKSETILQREGVGLSAVYRAYQSTPSGASAFTSLFDILTSNGTTVVGGPLYNVSNNGGAGSGTVSTGNRTTSAVDDAIVSGKGYFDSLVAFAATTYAAGDANKFPATVGLIRYDGTAFQVSTSVSSGVRVWVPLGGSSTPGGSNKSIQYNDAGAQGGDGNLTWDKAAKALVITGTAGQAAVTVGTGYLTSAGGLVSTVDSWQGVQGQASGSGASFAGYALAPVGGNRGGYIDMAPLGYANYPTPLTGLSAFGSTDVLLWASGTNGTSSPNTTYGLMTNAFVNAAGGFATSNTATSAIQAPSGGLTGKYLIGTTSLTMVADTQANAGLSSTGQIRIICDSGHSNKAYISENGGAYVPLVGSASAAGSSTQIQVNSGGVLSASSNFTWSSGVLNSNGTGGTFQVDAATYAGVVLVSSNASSLFDFNASTTGALIRLYGQGGLELRTSGKDPFFKANSSGNIGLCGATPSGTAGAVLTITGVAGVAGVALSNGYMQSAGGFLTTSSNYDSIQTSGGFKGYQLTFVSRSNPGLSGAGTAVLYMDSTSNTLQLSVNGGSYGPISGVTGTGNISVSAGVVSITNSPTFSGGVDCGTSGIVAAGHNVRYGGGSIAYGQNWKISISGSSFVIADVDTGSTIGTYTYLHWRGGSLVFAN